MKRETATQIKSLMAEALLTDFKWH